MGVVLLQQLEGHSLCNTVKEDLLWGQENPAKVPRGGASPLQHGPGSLTNLHIHEQPHLPRKSYSFSLAKGSCS